MITTKASNYICLKLFEESIIQGIKVCKLLISTNNFSSTMTKCISCVHLLQYVQMENIHLDGWNRTPGNNNEWICLMSMFAAVNGLQQMNGLGGQTNGTVKNCLAWVCQSMMTFICGGEGEDAWHESSPGASNSPTSPILLCHPRRTNSVVCWRRDYFLQLLQQAFVALSPIGEYLKSS